MQEETPKVGVQNLSVKADDDGIRLDKWFLRHVPDCGRGQLEKLCRTGQVRVDGKRVKTNVRVEEGQTVRVPPIAPRDPHSVKVKKAPKVSDKQIAELQNCVIHKDNDVLVLNKPAGLAVQGGTDTALHVDAMLDGLKFGNEERPRLVHRLDKDTSGVLVLARNRKAAQALTKAFRERTTKKLYWTVVAGVPDPEEGRVVAPIAKARQGAGEKMVVDEEDGKHAITDFRTIDTVRKRAAWLAMMPRTGRTHQLRVHCAYMDTPIVGDGKYGGREAFLPEAEGATRIKQMHLHARALWITHPSGGMLRVEAPLPAHMKATFQDLGFEEVLGREEPMFEIED